MEELYSIGETAKLNDVSIKSLRHYDEIGLLKPRYIDPETGYRYYCYSQFSFIDKIKRYKNIGMSLKELRDLFQSQDLSRLAAFLEEQKQMLDEEERLLQEKRQDVQWLADFFAYSKGLAVENDISIKEFPAMTMICVPCQGDDSMYAMDMELRRITVSPEFRSCQILNPYGYILDFDHLLKNEMYPSASTVCVRDAPDDSPYIFTAPAGRYLCCKARILSNHWNVDPLIAYCREHQFRPSLVLACEYLSSLYDPRNSPYELRLLLSDSCLPLSKGGNP
ncbi:helix-turn-helix domain-containing protein [uncultured Oscillibacter sp.]|uniref:MerR family transcriptional regulator n=1 Tax=uncultured Oscillibacter sp. TaxID=876091 RepID=UPI00262E15F7|nr:helix-turn-helix domain-containing protein [uncultured Oscillibacter sp.]